HRLEGAAPAVLLPVGRDLAVQQTVGGQRREVALGAPVPLDLVHVGVAGGVRRDQAAIERDPDRGREREALGGEGVQEGGEGVRVPEQAAALGILPQRIEHQQQGQRTGEAGEGGRVLRRRRGRCHPVG